MRQDYGIRGGQGRSASDTEDSGFWFGMCLLFGAVIVIMALTALWRESDRDQPEVRFVPNAERY